MTNYFLRECSIHVLLLFAKLKTKFIGESIKLGGTKLNPRGKLLLMSASTFPSSTEHGLVKQDVGPPPAACP